MEQTGTSHEQEGEALLIKGRVNEIEREQQEAKRRDEEYKQRQLLYNKRLAWFTLALVFTSLITIVIYFDMSCTARKAASAAQSAADTATLALKFSDNSFRQTLGQMQAQTAAQQNAAKAAVSAANIASESLVAVQRAIVDAQTIVYIPIPNISGKKTLMWRFYIPWENSGTTPTRHARTYSGWSLKEPDDSTFSRSLKAKFTPFVLGPKATLYSGEMDIPAGLIQIIQKETGPSRPIRLFFWGWVRYEDAFGGKHLSEACRELTGVDGNVTNPSSPVQMFYTLRGNHNCSDEGCRDFKNK